MLRTHEILLKDLETAAWNVFERRGGSEVVSAFTEAKTACVNAGIPDEKIQDVVHSVSQGIKRR